MSVTDWSPQPSGNAMADPSIPARDGMAGRDYPRSIRGVMASAAALALDQGGALVSSGSDNAYEVSTHSGFSEIKPGVSLSFWADRDSTGAPTLNVDGSGPRRLLSADGLNLPAGAIQAGLLYVVAWNAALPGALPGWRLVGSAAGGISTGLPGFDFSGSFSDRAQYDAEPKDKVFLAIADTPMGPSWTLYVKRSNSFGDWSAGLPIKASPAQSTADAQAAALAAATDRTLAAASAAAAAQSAAVFQGRAEQLDQRIDDVNAAREFADGQLQTRALALEIAAQQQELRAQQQEQKIEDVDAARRFAEGALRDRASGLEVASQAHEGRLNGLDVSADRSNKILSGDEPYYLLAPTHMFFIKGRRQTLNPARLVNSVSDALRYKPSLTLTGGDGVVARSYEASDGWEVALEDAYTSATVELRDRMGRVQRRYARPPASVFVSTDAFPSGTARKVALIGDSMTNYCRGYEERSILTSLGLAVQFVGTANTSGDRSNPGDQTGPLAEARPGISFADYINKTNVLQPVENSPAGVAAYLARSKGERLGYNPFIRLATGSDPANRVFNGYVFDYGFYLTRFGLDVPDDVVLALGYNDVFTNSDPTVALDNIDLGLLVMVSSIRAAAPNARIGLLTYAQARQPAADYAWSFVMAEYIRRHILFQVNFGDPRVFVLGGHLAMSLDAASIIDPATRVNYPDGSFFGDVTDPTHPDRPNYAKLAEVTAAFVAAGLNAPADRKRVNATVFGLSGRVFAQHVGGVYTRINDASGGAAFIVGNDGDPASYHTNREHYLQSKDGGTVYAAFLASAARFGTPLIPAADNTQTVGSASNRFQQFYAATATISTSDGRQKLTRGGATPAADWRVSPLTKEEIAAAADLARAIGVFLWRDAFEAKGEGARLHVGMIAQRVIAIMEAHGLDPFAYGFVCHDAWEETPAVEAVVGPAEIVDGVATGTRVLMPAQPARPAGDAYGLRTDELHAFVLAGQEARLAALETRLKATALAKKARP